MIHKISNLYEHKMSISKQDRQARNKTKSFILWFTGLSASGKSSIANEVECLLHQRHLPTYLLDGDNIRLGLNKDLGFHPEDRKENIRRIAEVGKLFVDAGVICLAAFISPYKEERELARSIQEQGEFIEIFVKCSLQTCEVRDPKGLYKKARSGEISNFTGISAPYQEPMNPELVLDTDKYSIGALAEKVVNYLISHDYIKNQ